VSGEERLKALHHHAPSELKSDAKHAPTAEKTVSRPTTNPKAGSPIEAGAKSNRPDDNDFLFGEEDPEALRCPYGAHIRRANPRDSFDPGSKEQIEISNRHRLLRVGRFYDPKPSEKPGLLFMCLNGNIERQFEFIQQTWLDSPSFHGLSGEQDPLVGGDSKSCTGFLIPSRDGPVRLKPLRRFVTTLGGGYFFLPSKRLLQFLGGDD
jgi:deferrochelatase/peroxidase EfeB